MVCNSGKLHMTLIQLDGSLQRVTGKQTDNKDRQPDTRNLYTDTARNGQRHAHKPGDHQVRTDVQPFSVGRKEVYVSNLHNSHAAYYGLPVLRTG